MILLGKVNDLRVKSKKNRLKVNYLLHINNLQKYITVNL